MKKHTTKQKKAALQDLNSRHEEIIAILNAARSTGYNTMTLPANRMGAVWLPADDPSSSLLWFPNDGREFTCDELKIAVGGIFDVLSLNHWCIVVNDKGAINGSPLNHIASCIAGQPIYGDVLVSPLVWVA